MLDNAATLSNERVVALSATSFSEDMIWEKEFLLSSGFHCVDSKIRCAVATRVDDEDVTIDQFLQRSNGYAKIIYNTDALYALPSNLTITERNCRDKDRLRSLSKDDVLLITEPILKIGIDYRASEGTTGIALLVMSSVSSERAYIQLLGRVGRYYEPCKRFLWSELEDRVCPYEKAMLLIKLKPESKIRRHQKELNKLQKGQQTLKKFIKQ